MPAAQYDIVFSGEVLDGFDPGQVRAKMGRVFNLSAEKLELLFSHPLVVLKGNLSAAQAEHYQSLLSRAGLKTALRRSSPAPSRAPAAAVAPPVRAQAASVPKSSEKAEAEPATHPFEFTGSGGQFFRIWIVNIFLTILTLGIYSAWAKVRTRRYFYGNTRLAGSAFEYLADPKKIFKGRVIAFALFGLVSVAGQFSPIAGLVATLLLFLATPWIIVQGLRFRARNSAWRNVRFDFDASAKQAVMAFVGWPLLGMLSAGLLMPYAFYRQQRFMVEHHRYGTAPFRFDAGAKPYYWLYLILIGLFAGAVLLGTLVSGAAVPPDLAPLVQPVLFVVLYLFAFAYFTVQTINLRYNHTLINDNGFAANYAVGSYSWLMLVNTLGVMVTLGLFYPWAKVRNARYAADHVQLVAVGDLDGFVAAQHQEVNALGQEMGDLFDVELGF